MNNDYKPHMRDPVHDRIMSAIQSGEAYMKPRWYFMLLSALLAIGVLGVSLLLLYAVSLSVFLLRESGVWFATSFGLRGWWTLVQSIPISHVVFITGLILILEAMIRRYSFVYRRPLVGSFVVVAAFIVVGGVLIADTPFHRDVASYVRARELPAPLSIPYGPSIRVARPPDLYEGVVVAKENGVLVIEHDVEEDIVTATSSESSIRPPEKKDTPSKARKEDNFIKQSNDRVATTAVHAIPQEKPRYKEDDRTEKKNERTREKRKKKTRIVITPQTRLPHKRDFEIGSNVIVEGDTIDHETIKAFGVRDIDD